jgi:peptidyl-prolyl cis-trans isomerase SurA
LVLRGLLVGSVVCALLGAAHGGRTIDRIVAVVNDEIILDSELEEFTAPQLRNPVDLDTVDGARTFDALKKKSLERLIESRLIGQQAHELKLTVTTEEVDRAIDEVKRQNKLDDATFVEALKSQGFSMDAYRKNLKKQILELKVVNTAVRSRVSISEEEIKTAYNQSDRQYAGERLAHLREVVLYVAKDAPPDELEKKRKLATKVVAEARGGRSFQELAKAYSESDSKAEGGDLGFLQTGALVDELAEVIAQMDPGDVRGPIRTKAGFSVLELVEWKSGNLRPFEEVKEQLRRQLYDQQVEKATSAWVKELRKKAHVDIR